ncbi:hypothetical protein M758_6G209400 [Ceratodon purpureus]|uniref:Uncharacterized protein n=1 Tax=Ceratodon purpureus TaxID=3225 RepID=A0A8T0HK60_CERPU|nr:hypothetical protein KC19_6G219000 [Ceratodon purpureus]KAG0614860.1 hypothetical protein M758_6G209400 [Ceratodon purpureus]
MADVSVPVGEQHKIWQGGIGVRHRDGGCTGCMQSPVEKRIERTTASTSSCACSPPWPRQLRSQSISSTRRWAVLERDGTTSHLSSCKHSFHLMRPANVNLLFPSRSPSCPARQTVVFYDYW